MAPSVIYKFTAFDTIGNQSNLCYMSEKPKEVVGHAKSMLPAASLWLIHVVVTHLCVLL